MIIATHKNYLAKIRDLNFGEFVYFRRGSLSIEVVCEAILREFPDDSSLLISAHGMDHGSSVFVYRLRELS